ncbi:MAG: BolA family protein [Pseudohongiellaceae bacterium]|jgi:acid stress-induced BolA-like protein IbaG/YrbA
MAMQNSALSLELSTAFPGAKVAVSGGDGKYQVHVVSSEFAGLNRVKRQQAVYRVVNAHIQSGAIHAINMLLQTPEEHAQEN